MKSGTSYSIQVQARNANGVWGEALTIGVTTQRKNTSNVVILPPIATNGQAGGITLKPGEAGSANLDGQMVVSIPAGMSNKELKLTVNKLSDLSATSSIAGEASILLSPIFDVQHNIGDRLAKSVTITISFDSGLLKENQAPAIYYYDEEKKVWTKIGGVVHGSKITAEVDRLAKFAVFADTGKVI